MPGFAICVIISSILAGVCSANEDQPPVVRFSESSAIKGLILKAVDSEKSVYNFRGIYYAAPPTGSRRFAPPARPKPIEGLADGTQFGPLCPQDIEVTTKSFRRLHLPTQEVSEDCLHLNIYTPTLDEEANLAVMVYFHGGSFSNGGAGFYDGTALATHHQVVVVTVNSRLGALGYLSTGDAASPGNYGLLDQGASLQWIRAHIQKFGGNPTMVTIMGESSGGMSVGLHVLSPLNEGLFQRAIAESGVPSSPMTIIREPKELAVKLALTLKCPTDNTRMMVDCLRQKPADEIAKIKVTKRPIEFGPVVDGYFLKDDPREIQSKGPVTKKEVLLGYNSDEGGKSLFDVRLSSEFFKLLSAQTFEKFLEQMLHLVVPKDLPIKPLVRAISNIYIGEDKLRDDDKAKQLLSDIVGDSMFVAPVISTAEALCQNGLSVFMYEFEHRSSFSNLPPWAKADHGDEEAYVWGEPFMDGKGTEPGKFTEEERELSRAMMLYWANFAKYGTPNGVTKPDDGYHPVSYWPQYIRGERKYLKLDATPEVSENPKAKKVEFWTKLFSFWKLSRRRKEEL